MFQLLTEHHSVYALFKVHWMIFILIALLTYQKVKTSPLYIVSPRHLISFYTAMTLLLLIKATPLDVLGYYYLFSAQVFQDAIIYFVIVPLIILSFPVNFYRQYIWNFRVRFIISILAHPWLTLIAFNGLLTLYYIPFFYNAIHAIPFIAAIVQLILTLNAILMWWVILQPIPELKNFEHLLRAAYIFFASLALMPIGFFFLIKLEAHFPIYIEVAQQIVPVLTPIYDQQLAGGLLKITQMFSYAVALLFIMFHWAKTEQAFEGQADDDSIRYVRGVVVHMDNKEDDDT